MTEIAQPKLNLPDRIIRYLSPMRAARRAAARHALEFQAYYYKGARSTRLTNNWATTQESIDTTFQGGELQTLRDRSRDLNRSDPIAAGITDTFCVNAISTGITPQSAIVADMVPATPDQIARAQQQAEWVWDVWQKRAEVTGRMTFPEIEFLATRQILESGEFLAVRRSIQRPGIPYLLTLQIVEPDRLDTPNGASIQPNMRYGIEQNTDGAPIAYHIRRSHPGDIFRTSQNAYEYQRIPAFDDAGRPNVFHVFPILRPGQTRGVPFFAPVIERFKILADYLDAELVRARVSACFAAFVKTSNPYGSAVGRSDETANSQRLESLEPGTIEYLGEEQEITFSNPTQPGTTFDQFVERILRMIGAALGLPIELVLKDFSKTNYSSARAALLQAYRMFGVWQQMIINHLCQPLWELLFEEAVLRGQIEAPSFELFKPAYTRATWIPPGWQWVDPQKEVEAHKTAVEMDFETLAEVCASRGGDWEANLEQKQRIKAKYESLGLEMPTPPDQKKGKVVEDVANAEAEE